MGLTVCDGVLLAVAVEVEAALEEAAGLDELVGVTLIAGLLETDDDGVVVGDEDCEL